MYRILGADGKEDGPVNGEALRRWITESCTIAHTKVRVAGGTGWRMLVSACCAGNLK